MEWEKTYAKNRAALRTHHPAIHALLPERAPGRDAITAAPDGRLLLKWAEKGRWITISYPRESLVPARLEALDADQRSGMDFLYFIGLGHPGWLTGNAPAFTRENRGILVLEPSLEFFTLILCLTDLRPCLTQGRIFWAVGDTVRQQAAAVFDETLCAAAANPFFYASLPFWSDARRSAIEELLIHLQGEAGRRKSDFHQMLRQLPDALKNRAPGPLRIWSFDDLRGKARYSLIQSVLIRNLLFHLRTLGYQTEYTVLRDGRYYPPYYRILKMARFRPDVIFLCNQGPAYDTALGAELSRSLPVPKIVWFADDPLHGEHLLARNGTSPDETYLVADGEWPDTLLHYGATDIRYMPGAVTRTRRGEKRPSRRCDVVFVGQVRDQRAFFEALSPAWRAYSEQVIEDKLRFPRIKLKEILARFAMPGELPADRLDEFRQALLWEANTRFRLQVIQSLADCDLRVYGNPDWERLLPPSLSARCFKGILPFSRLFEVYRNSRITLNIHSLQSYTCLNVRDFDVPAAGGFLLSDWLLRANEVFCPGLAADLPLTGETRAEVFFYRNLGELRRLVEYFLEHEDQRQACIERARERVLSGHTYRHRALWLHGLIQERLARA